MNATNWYLGGGNTKAVIMHSTNGGVKVSQTGNAVPEKMSLEQNYPNPFNPTTKIRYDLRSSDQVSLKIINPLGKVCAILVDQKQNAGSYEVEFTADGLTSGIYFYHLIQNGVSDTKSMILQK